MNLNGHIMRVMIAFLAGAATALPFDAAAQDTSTAELTQRHRHLLGAEAVILREGERLRAIDKKAREARIVDTGFRLGSALDEGASVELMVGWYAASSREFAFREEVQTKFQWLQQINRDLVQKIETAKTANPAFARVLRKEIRHDIERAERLATLFLGNPQPAPNATAKDRPGSGQATSGQPAGGQPAGGQPASNQGAATRAGERASGGGEKPKLKKLTGFASGILFQMRLHDETLKFQAREINPRTVQLRAIQDFGDGRAGGGGVSLHVAATVDGLDPASVNRAGIENGRLVLTLKNGQKAVFPKVPQDDLAVAINNVYGAGNGITGKLKVVDGDAIVLETGKKNFGDVVWRRQFVPGKLPRLTVGEEVSLPIGPGLGILALPEASTQRITYYGSIRNTRMGDVMARADQLLMTFLFGIDPATGRTLPPPQVDGYKTVSEMTVRSQTGSYQPVSKPLEPRADNGVRGWWRTATWLVWVPQKIVISPSGSGGNSYEFTETRMQLDTWTTDLAGVPLIERDLSTYVTKNYDRLAAAYPVLAELKEMAQTVAMVRWLKQNGIELDLAWARAHKTKPVETANVIPSFLFYLMTDDAGQPIVRKATAGGSPRGK